MKRLGLRQAILSKKQHCKYDCRLWYLYDANDVSFYGTFKCFFMFFMDSSYVSFYRTFIFKEKSFKIVHLQLKEIKFFRHTEWIKFNLLLSIFLSFKMPAVFPSFLCFFFPVFKVHSFFFFFFYEFLPAKLFLLSLAIFFSLFVETFSQKAFIFFILK